jgi:hypothetical protein
MKKLAIMAISAVAISDIQLVIMVPEKYGFFKSLFHHSVTKKLAFHTHIPLLLLKEII